MTGKSVEGHAGMDDAVGPNLRAQLDGPYYLGPTTFMKRPGADEVADLERLRPDVAIVGAPWDDSASYRPGARFGPRAVRAPDVPGSVTSTSRWRSSTSSTSSTTVTRACRRVLGGVARGDPRPRPRGRLTRRSCRWSSAATTRSPGPSATAVAETHGRRASGSSTSTPTPTRRDRSRQPPGHGTPMRRLIESGAVPGRNFVQVGLRGYWPPAGRAALDARAGDAHHLMHESGTAASPR